MCEFTYLLQIHCLWTLQKDLYEFLRWDQYGIYVCHIFIFSVSKVYPYKIWIRDTTCGPIIITISDTDTPSGSVVIWLLVINPSKGFLSQSSANIHNTFIYYVLTPRPEILLDIEWNFIFQNLKNLNIHTSNRDIYTSNHVYLYFKIPYLYFNFIFLYFKSWL